MGQMRRMLQHQPNLVKGTRLPAHAPLQRPDVGIVSGDTISTTASELKSCPRSEVGFDFSSIRIFPVSPHEAAAQPDVLAATLGDQIHLAPALSDLPAESQRAVMAHEFAHVAQQQNQSGRAADEAALEREAGAAGCDLLAGRPPNVRLRASATQPHYKREKYKGKEYEIGDVVLNSAAHTDIISSGSLIEHQGIIVYGNQLGYEVGYTAPEDPFRWNQIKSIVDTEHIDIRSVGVSDDFKVLQVSPPDAPVTLKLNLGAWPGGAAGGVTLPTLSRQQAIDPGAKTFVASPDAKRDQIYYETGKGGHGLRGANSLAHELFGHFGLARQGAAWAHKETVGTSPRVSDPFGQPFVGSVDNYIKGFAEAEIGVGSSPTRFVSPAFLAKALKDLAANGEKGLTRKKTATTDGYMVSVGWKMIWITLSQNYRALGFTRAPAPAATTTPAPATLSTQTDIVDAVMGWFRGLSADGQFVFRQYLDDELLQIGHEAPTDLLSAVMAKLPKAQGSGAGSGGGPVPGGP